jgi:hypothetical protein
MKRKIQKVKTKDDSALNSNNLDRGSRSSLFPLCEFPFPPPDSTTTSILPFAGHCRCCHVGCYLFHLCSEQFSRRRLFLSLFIFFVPLHSDSHTCVCWLLLIAWLRVPSVVFLCLHCLLEHVFPLKASAQWGSSDERKFSPPTQQTRLHIRSRQPKCEYANSSSRESRVERLAAAGRRDGGGRTVLCARLSHAPFLMPADT